MSTSFALFRQHRIADLCTAQRLLHNFWQHKSLPAANDVTAGSIGTPIAAMLLTYLLVVLLTPQGRKRTWELLEAVLATLLMLCLLVAVLGMPVGKC